MKLAFDAYDRQARLAVTYLVFSPAVIFVVAMSLGTKEWWSKLGGILVACGAPFLAAQWGRTAGRRKEPVLFQRWGGSPTVRLLRFASGEAVATVDHRHADVARATGVELPTRAEEYADPARADAVYGNAIAALRELTRDKAAFPLVFGENVGYGFRRNLWGRKSFGLAVSGLTTIVSLAVLVVSATQGAEHRFAMPAGFSLAYAVVACLVWWRMVTEDWVKQSAEAYAQRLIESAVRVPSSGS